VSHGYKPRVFDIRVEGRVENNLNIIKEEQG